jgi:hypothetical protein
MMFATVHGKLLKNLKKTLMKIKNHKFRNLVEVKTYADYFPLEAPCEF